MEIPMRSSFLSPGSDRDDDHDLARAWSGMDRIARLPLEQRGFALFETRGDYRPLGLSPEDVDGIDASHPAFPQAVAQRDVEPVVSHPIPNPRPVATAPIRNEALQVMSAPDSGWEPVPEDDIAEQRARYEIGRQNAIDYLSKIAPSDLAYVDAQATKSYLESGVLTPSFYRANGKAPPTHLGFGYDGNRVMLDIDGAIKDAQARNPQSATR